MWTMFYFQMLTSVRALTPAMYMHNVPTKLVHTNASVTEDIKEMDEHVQYRYFNKMKNKFLYFSFFILMIIKNRKQGDLTLNIEILSNCNESNMPVTASLK